MLRLSIGRVLLSRIRTRVPAGKQPPPKFAPPPSMIPVLSPLWRPLHKLLIPPQILPATDCSGPPPPPKRLASGLKSLSPLAQSASPPRPPLPNISPLLLIAP